MGLNFSSTVRKALLSVIFSMMLIPALVSASTEFKGTEIVNINKANASALAAYLKGVGPSKAEAIVGYRKSNGSFKKIDDLKNVPGIGDETFKNMKKNVSTSRGISVAPKGYTMPAANSSSSKRTIKKKAPSSSKSRAATSNTRATTSSTRATTSNSPQRSSSKLADLETKKKKVVKKKKPAKKKTTKKKTTKDKK